MKSYRMALLALVMIAMPLQAADSADQSTDKQDDKGASNTVYKTVGPDGKVVFSDTPPPGQKSEKVTIGPTNVQPIAPPQPIPTRRLSPGDREGYQRNREEGREEIQGPVNFMIVSPGNDATIPPGQRFIVLEVAMDPVPRDGYEFFAVIDGQRWGGTSSGSSLDISALERGTHTVQAVLLDAGGQAIAQTQTIQIHVKRPGGQVPDFPAQQAPQAPKAPQAPGYPRARPQKRQ